MSKYIVTVTATVSVNVSVNDSAHVPRLMPMSMIFRDLDDDTPNN